ncbi:MAG TPA: PQQ-dependent sugar dehydrogenase [Guyparkeria sp.]|nr:PQQ-dependent sugar dehydrogenase [Guyparkeria sp.]
MTNRRLARVAALVLLASTPACSEPMSMVEHRNQGGLLDVTIYPAFKDNHWVYLTWAGRCGGNATHLGRGRLQGDHLIDWQVLFVATPLRRLRHPFQLAPDFRSRRLFVHDWRRARLEFDGETVLSEEQWLAGRGWRIRDIAVGPDGALWVITDHAEGRLLRLTPE